MSTDDGAPRRRKGDQRSVVERNALVEAMPADADLIQVVAQNARQNAVNSRIITWLTGSSALMAVLVAMLGVVIAVLIVSISQQDHSLREIRQIGVANRANGDVVRDCNTPGGKCYQQQQQRIEGAVGELTQTMLAVGECLSKRPQSEKILHACVSTALKSGGGK